MGANTFSFSILIIATFALFGGVGFAGAAHESNLLHQRIAALDCIADRLLFDFTAELQCGCRWPPRRPNRALYDAFYALEKCAGQVHSFYEGRRSKYQIRKHLAATRQTLENAKCLAAQAPLSTHIRQLIAEFDRALCAVEACYAGNAPSILRPSHSPHFGYSIGLSRMSL